MKNVLNIVIYLFFFFLDNMLSNGAHYSSVEQNDWKAAGIDIDIYIEILPEE